MKAFKILKQSINPTKNNFAVNFSSSSTFQFPAYILSYFKFSNMLDI